MPKKPLKQSANTVRAIQREGKTTAKNIKRNVKALAKVFKKKPAKKTAAKKATKKSVAKKSKVVKQKDGLKHFQPQDGETYDGWVERLRKHPDVNKAVPGVSYIADYKAGQTNTHYATLRQLLNKLDSYELSRRYGDTLLSDPNTFDDTISIHVTRDTGKQYQDKRKSAKIKRESKTVEIRKELGKQFGTKTKEGRSKTTTDYLFDLADVNKKLNERLAKLEKLISKPVKKATKKGKVKKNGKSTVSKRSVSKSPAKSNRGTKRKISSNGSSKRAKSANSKSAKRVSAKSSSRKAKTTANKRSTNNKGSNKAQKGNKSSRKR